MSASELGPWEPLEIESVVGIFATAPFRWWIGGGCALDLHLGRTWRPHDDIDVGVLRKDLHAVRGFLSTWDLQVAAAGHLSSWTGKRSRMLGTRTTCGAASPRRVHGCSI